MCNLVKIRAHGCRTSSPTPGMSCLRYMVPRRINMILLGIDGDVSRMTNHMIPAVMRSLSSSLFPEVRSLVQLVPRGQIAGFCLLCLAPGQEERPEGPLGRTTATYTGPSLCGSLLLALNVSLFLFPFFYSPPPLPPPLLPPPPPPPL